MAVNKRKILDLARKYVQKGAKQKALKEYERLLKLDPKDGKLRLEIGDAHRRWGQVDEAVSHYLKVADQYKADGFDARSVAVYKQVLNLDPKRYSAHVSLSELYQRMGLDAEAVAALQSAADGYHKEGNKREALELLRRMATLDPSNTTSRLKVAELLKQEGMNDEAVSEYEAIADELHRQENLEGMASAFARILELQPKRVDILARTARTLLQLRQPERAEAFAVKARDGAPDESDHYELLCDIYRALGRTEDLVESTRGLARIYRERGEEDRAREMMQRVPGGGGFEVAPSEEAPASEFTDEEAALGDDELLDDDFLAADEASESAEEAPVFGDASDLGEPLPFDELVAPSEAAAAVADDTPPEPDAEPLPEGDPDQLMAEASVYMRYGKSREAIASLRSIIAQDEAHRDAHEKLGDAYAQASQTAEAVGAWTRAAELAHAARDGEMLDSLRARVAELDAEAATALPVLAEPEPQVEEPAPQLEPRAPEPGTDEDGGFELDISSDDGLDLELDDFEDVDEVAPSEVPATPGSESDEDVGFEIDLDGVDVDAPQETEAGGDLEVANEGIETDRDEADEGIETDRDGADEGIEIDLDAADVSEGDAPASGSGSGQSTNTSQQIHEDLEEAEFFFSQGMLDEAAAVYKRVLSLAPNHPSAMLRLGEIEAQRGDSAEAEAPTEQPSLALDLDSSVGDATETVSASEAIEEPTALEAPPAPELQLESVPAETDAAPASEDDPSALAATSEDDPSALAPASDLDPSAPATASEAEESAAARAPAPERDRAGQADETQPMESERLPTQAADDDGDDSTFDLAAELREAFEDESHDPAGDTQGVLSTVGDGFAAIFSEFKRGVSETLSASDSETRYDLGIAYREMGLFEDAIAEFRACLVHPGKRDDCLVMMGLCALDLHRFQDAINHFEQVLGTADLDDARRAGLCFDLGRALMGYGDLPRARAAFEEAQGLDPGFPGLHERLAELAEVSAGGTSSPDLESFEDLDFDTTEEAPAESFESFDDVLLEAESPEEDAAPEPEAAPGAAGPEAPGDSGTAKPRRRKISFV